MPRHALCTAPLHPLSLNIGFPHVVIQGTATSLERGSNTPPPEINKGTTRRSELSPNGERERRTLTQTCAPPDDKATLLTT